MRTTVKKYDRFSRVYDLIETPVEKHLFSSLRKRVWERTGGKVLEVGIGTGKNMPYYPDGMEVTGVDFSKGMLEKAQKRKESLSLENVRLLEMDIEDMSFGDETFDTVVSTFVFCTVPDPLQGLREVYRVLRPGGRAVFLEHMRSRRFVLNIPLSVMNVFTVSLVGTSMLRETQKNIELAGFRIQEVHNVAFDIVRLIVAGK